MKTSRFLTLSLLALCLLTGCIEFARQTVSYHHDEKTDTLYLFQDYQGIFGAGNKDQLSPEESEQLASVMKGGRTFFFNNWILEYDKSKAQEALAKPKGEIDKNPDYEAAIRELAGLALENIQITNIGFYKNPDGQLCGAQQITIRNVSKLLLALNRTIPFIVRDMAREEDKTPDERQSLISFAESKRPAVQLHGNQLTLLCPSNAKDFKEFDSGQQAAGLRAAGGTVMFHDGIVTLTLGKPDSKVVSLTAPFSEKPYAANAVAEAGRYGIKTAFDPKKASGEFLKSLSQKIDR